MFILNKFYNGILVILKTKRVWRQRRRMNLIRWGRFTTSEWWDKKPDPNDKDYEVFPIPKRQLDTNQLLKQTTKGW